MTSKLTYTALDFSDIRESAPLVVFAKHQLAVYDYIKNSAAAFD